MGEFVVRYPIWDGWRETGSGRSDDDLFCKVEDQYEGTEKASWLGAQGSFGKITIGWNWNKGNRPGDRIYL